MSREGQTQIQTIIFKTYSILNDIHTCHIKSKITKVLIFEENSQRKVPHITTKSNDKTHQPNGQYLPYS